MRENSKNKKKRKPREFGPTAQKIILLLSIGAVLGLTHRPDYYFRVVHAATKAWKEIDRKTLNRNIKRLYQAKMLNVVEGPDGTVTMTLSDKGKEKAVQYNIEKMKLPHPEVWDKKWRVYLFDIPEYHRKARDAFRFHIKELGMYKFQKSAWVYPFSCEKELQFLIEFYEVQPYVRYMLVDIVDNELHLKKIFNLD